MILPKFKNDSDRLKSEYDALQEKNPNLLNVMLDLATFVHDKYNKELVLTMIFRTDEEQAEFYKDDPKFQAKPFKSPHQVWDAFDLRSTIFNPEEIKEIVDYLNTKYNTTNYFSFTALYHEVGALGLHFHVQYLKKAN